MYQTLYNMCRSAERVMHMFSEELRELNRNTVDYMIEEQQRIIDQGKLEIEQLRRENARKQVEIDKLSQEIGALKVQMQSTSLRSEVF